MVSRSGPEPLGWAEALALNELFRAVTGSPEMSATLRAITAALAPRHAARALVVLADRRFDSEGSEPLGPDASLPLTVDGECLGRLYLFGPRGDPRGPLFAAIAECCAAALATAARFERERHVALTFQNAALASSLPQSPSYTFDAFYQPGKSEALVGGDWYDAFPLKDGRVVVSIGDVLGSGLAAAIAMVNVRQTIRGVAHVHPDPAILLAAADRTLQAQYPDRFATALVAILDPVTQRCSYANAGHPPPLMRLRDGRVVVFPGHGIPLGLGFGSYPAFETSEIATAPGSCILLYTDGLIESTRNVVDGERRLEDVLRRLDPGSPKPATHVHDAVVGAQAFDDVAILLVGMRDDTVRPSWRFDPVWSDVTRRVRDEIVALLDVAEFGAERRTQIELAFAELMGNSLRHAPGTIEVLLESSPAHVILHVLDRGPGYEPQPHLPSDLYREDGRGLFLVANLADRFVVERRPGGGSHARITFHRTKET